MSILLLCRHPDEHSGAGAGLAFDFQFSAQHFCPFAYSEQPQPSARQRFLHIKSLAIILDNQRDLVVLARDRDAHVRGPRGGGRRWSTIPG